MLQMHRFTDDFGRERAIIGGLQVLEDDDPRLWADVLNWFEDSQLVIGNKTNSDHVARWQAWQKSLEEETA